MKKVLPARKRLYNLRYKMRQRGYVFNNVEYIVIVPELSNRSALQEKRIKKFGFDLQNKLI
jgi:hypothetical protein